MSHPLVKTLSPHLRLGKSRLKDRSSCSKSDLGQLRKSSGPPGRTVPGGGADEIEAKADLRLEGRLSGVEML